MEKVIGRASWRIISSIVQKEESRGNEGHVSTIREYRSKIESELSSICDGILKLLDSKLIGSALSFEESCNTCIIEDATHQQLSVFYQVITYIKHLLISNVITEHVVCLSYM
ncbi:putative 14-3-3 protein [Helianthus annuus]|nr:putative 14-3-3 protein [Helianthus annuus]